jgi:hypothetical protein
MKNVAVKTFGEHKDVNDLLEQSKKPKNLLYAYREIRQEVSFLSNLNHRHLAKLYGVRTTPFMCMLLELAKESLRGILKEYKSYSVVLEPVTLKITALQVCNSSGRGQSLKSIP